MFVKCTHITVNEKKSIGGAQQGDDDEYLTIKKKIVARGAHDGVLIRNYIWLLTIGYYSKLMDILFSIFSNLKSFTCH